MTDLPRKPCPYGCDSTMPTAALCPWCREKRIEMTAARPIKAGQFVSYDPIRGGAVPAGTPASKDVTPECDPERDFHVGIPCQCGKIQP